MTKRPMMENARGEWVPAIPLPRMAWDLWWTCDCGNVSLTKRRYREHYAYEHIVMGR